MKHELITKVETLGPAKPRADSTVSAPGDTWHPVDGKPELEVNGRGQLRTKAKPEHGDSTPGWIFPFFPVPESGLYDSVSIRQASPEQQAEHRERLVYETAHAQKVDYWLNAQRALNDRPRETIQGHNWGTSVTDTPAYQARLNRMAIYMRLLDSVNPPPVLVAQDRGDRDKTEHWTSTVRSTSKLSMQGLAPCTREDPLGMRPLSAQSQKFCERWVERIKNARSPLTAARSEEDDAARV